MTAGALVKGDEPKKSDTKEPAANVEDVEAIFSEIIVPAFKPAGEDFDAHKLALAQSFPTSAIRPYPAVGPAFDEIVKDPKKYEHNFPVRAAVAEAVISLRKPVKNLPFQFASPIGEQVKYTIERTHQRTVAEWHRELEEIDTRLATVARKRGRERPDRWLAHSDYIGAQVKLRFAWCHEFNLALGKARFEQVPELDAKLNQNGWRLMAVGKMSSPKEIRDMAEEARETLGQLEKNYPNTPWAYLGNKQKDIKLGLQWQPAVLPTKKK
jgi:hypothetical protein